MASKMVSALAIASSGAVAAAEPVVLVMEVFVVLVMMAEELVVF